MRLSSERVVYRSRGGRNGQIAIAALSVVVGVLATAFFASSGQAVLAGASVVGGVWDVYRRLTTMSFEASVSAKGELDLRSVLRHRQTLASRVRNVKLQVWGEAGHRYYVIRYEGGTARVYANDSGNRLIERIEAFTTPSA